PVYAARGPRAHTFYRLCMNATRKKGVCPCRILVLLLRRGTRPPWHGATVQHRPYRQPSGRQKQAMAMMLARRLRQHTVSFTFQCKQFRQVVILVLLEASHPPPADGPFFRWAVPARGGEMAPPPLDR
ncbi:unnamed protein product, partial [Ectocarpus sp. 12 AP-2014]